MWKTFIDNSELINLLSHIPFKMNWSHHPSLQTHETYLAMIDSQTTFVNIPLNWQRKIHKHIDSSRLNLFLHHISVGWTRDDEINTSVTKIWVSQTQQILFCGHNRNSIFMAGEIEFATAKSDKSRKGTPRALELMENSSSLLFTSFSMSHMPLIIYCIFQCRRCCGLGQS